MRSICHFITNPKDILISLLGKTASVWPDKTYLKVAYYLRTGRKLNLDNPRTFTEKLNWLKLNDIHPEYSLLVGKDTAKDVVEREVGTHVLIPTLATWTDPAAIDLSELPEKFVLKTTNGGGSSNVIICKDKKRINDKEISKKLQLIAGDKLFKWSREYPYKSVKPKIIAEVLLESKNGDLMDYKFFCFNGRVRFLKIDTTRQTNHHATYLFPNWEIAPFRESQFPALSESQIPNAPDNFNQMIQIAEALSKDKPFVRVDLYNVDGKVYFGEMTFFPAAAFGLFTPFEWEERIGEYITLPTL